MKTFMMTGLCYVLVSVGMDGFLLQVKCCHKCFLEILFWHSFYVAQNHCEHANITESVLGDKFFGQFFGL
jgi:hypothetical protein